MLNGFDDGVTVKTGNCIYKSITQTDGTEVSQIERKALGCVWAIKRLHNYLFGIKFTLLTDNKPLSKMFDPHSSTVLPPCIQRLASIISQGMQI